MSHPTSRVATVFFAGVIGGALGSAVLTTDEMPLTGASGIYQSINDVRNLLISFLRSKIFIIRAINYLFT